MNKTKRLLIVLLVLAVAFGFLFPSIEWYYLTPKEDQTLALGSRETIRDQATRLARVELAALNEYVSAKPDDVLPGTFAALVDRAKVAYKDLGMKRPDAWTADAVLAAYDGDADVLKELEDIQRQEIMKTKNLHGNAVQLGLDLSGGMSVVIRADLDALAEKLGHSLSLSEREEAMERAMDVLNGRIDKFGLTEPVIRRQGEDHIYIEIPGAADPDRINSIIMGRGRLAFHIVDIDATNLLLQYLASNPAGINADLTLADPSVLPEGLVVRRLYKKDAYGLDEWTGDYVVITEAPGLDGNYIESADSSSDQITGQPQVIFTLTAEGGELFYQLTSANIGKPMAVVLDDKVRSVATIRDAIQTNGSISGFSYDEAENLKVILRSAALPVELVVESQQSIGASLGDDTIRQGANAMIIALAAVFIFMLIYYKGAGINAMVAQVLNLYLMLSILSAFNLTLTLPTIAGFVLTLGMAVDANVIIFERVKEELALGKGRRAAVEAGFAKAFWAVMDGNITTIIAALFLAQLGTGPIQGFAVSLAIGNMSSLFTSLFVSRLIFDYGTDLGKKETMSISWRIK
ncbi:MAG: protein translocase subunit SecD [Spirochaetales bacterium]|nr:protein translocase subunit SecD [Spirochaetales bacterium]